MFYVLRNHVFQSKQILQRLESRQLYKFIGTHQIDEEVKEVYTLFIIIIAIA